MLQEKRSSFYEFQVRHVPGHRELRAAEDHQPNVQSGTGFVGVGRALLSLSHPSQAQSGALVLLLLPREAEAVKPLTPGTKYLSL